VESRLVGAVFRIFATEVLGYDISIVSQPEPAAMLDRDIQFQQLASCTNALCDDYNSSPDADEAPTAMLTLDLWLPPSYHVDTWGLVDAGQLGPAVRFGWFMPNRTASMFPPSMDHWKIFTDPETANSFHPAEDQMDFVKRHLRTPENSYYCTHEQCTEGIFEPPECKKRNSKCGLLITAHPSNSSLYKTSHVFNQILSQNLLIKVAFVGPHLPKVVEHLENSSPNMDRSYLVLHYAPSILTIKHSLVPLLFPRCKDPLLQRDDSDTNCLYTANRLAKVVWNPVQNEAPGFFRFIQHFGFSFNEYSELLETFNKETDSDEPFDYDEIACTWLNLEKTNVRKDGRRTTKTIYRQKIDNLPLQGKPELYIGGIFPITGNKYKAPELAKVAQMAVADVNLNPSILNSHKLVMSINDGMCEADVVMKRFIDIIKTKDTSRFRSTVGMLGPACSDTVEPIAGVSKHFRTVVISYSAEGSISSDNSNDYPYFFRTIAENKQYKHAYIATLKKLDWSKVAALTQDGQKYSDYMSLMQDEFQNNGIEFVMNRKFPKEATDMSMYLQDLKDRGAKIIIGEFYASSARLIMCEAFKAKMTQKQGYVWFLPGWFDDKWYDIDGLRRVKNKTESTHLVKESDSILKNGGTIQMFEDTDVGDLPSCSTSEMLQALNGHLSLVHANFAPDENMVQGNRTVQQWKAALRKNMRETKNNYHNAQRKNSDNDIDIDFDLDDQIKVNKYSGYVYDAVWLYAQALDTLVSENKTASYIQNLHSDQTVTEFVNIIKNMDFEGVSGRINFKGRPSRLSNVRIMQWLKTTANVVVDHDIGVYIPYYGDVEGKSSNNTEGEMNKWNDRLIRWQTLDGKKPLDNPKECGMFSSFATKLDIDCQLAITIVFIIGFAILLLLIFIVFLMFRRRYEMKMKATEDRMRALGLLTPMSVLALDDWEIARDRVVINRKLGEGAFGTVCGGESFFDEKGWVAVAVKTLKLGSTVEEKIDFLSEAEMMKRFEHKNIVKLLGVCTRNEPVYTVMEFMLYGDLKTYLLARRHLVNERNREDLDEVSNRRLTSMAYDVAKGLEYLAELKYVHRDIACRNCLVNSSRTVKLADFGMSRPMFESDYYRFSKKGMLPVRWMSPESLADGLFTPMSDIWSYGVLLYEMITFGSFPFQGLSNNQVLSHVKSGNTLTIPQGIRYQM